MPTTSYYVSEIANGLLTHTLYDVFMDDMIVEIQDNNISSESPMRKKQKRSLETDILSEAEIITMSGDWKEIEEELITDINGKDNTDIHQVSKMGTSSYLMYILHLITNVGLYIKHLWAGVIFGSDIHFVINVY